jgi:hypothetical protein
MPDSLRRLAPLTGVVFAGLLVVTFLSPISAGIHKTGLEVIAHEKLHHSASMVGDFCGALGVAFFLFFVGSLRSFLRRHEGGEGPSAVAFGGAVLLGTGGAIFSSLDWALGDTRNTISPAAAQAINILSNDLFWPFQIGIAVFGIAIGIAIINTGALPKWLGWVAFVLGVVGFTPVGFFGFLVFLIWSVIVAIMVFLRSGETAASAAGGSASLSGQGA